MQKPHKADASFESFSLDPKILKALHRMEFTIPTPIQAASLPFSLEGRDLVGSAQTGTGKTAAFLIPAISEVLRNPRHKVLVLSPTRELALQISEVLSKLTMNSRDLRAAVLIGGASMGKQLFELRRNPTFIIATPGRLNDHLERRTVDLSTVKVLVLDEVDRMLDMGFLPQIENVLETLPKERQTLFFSATLPPKIRKLVKRYTKNPQFISIGSTDRPVERIHQRHLETPHQKKSEKILSELRTRSGPVLVFARTQHRTERLSTFLKANGVKSTAIHGGRSQRQRQEALQGFQEGKFPVLVATDVASRGLDIPDIKLVVNYDLPETNEDYIHRIGRTARAGSEGEALSFVTPEETSQWKRISKISRPGR